jgi:hypothetical protein
VLEALNAGVTPAPVARNAGVKAPLAAGSRVEDAWRKARTKMFAGKFQRPDAEDPDVVGHMNWYFATNFAKPYPGERKVRMPGDFPNLLVTRDEDDDEDKAGE